MPTTPRITGVDAVIRAGRKMQSHDGRNLKKGVDSCLSVILRRAAELCPKDTLALVGSGEAVVVDGVGLNVQGMVMFGGPAAPHAFVVHERTDVFHAPPTRAHYLTAAVNETRGTCTSILRRQMTVRSSGSMPEVVR